MLHAKFGVLQTQALCDTGATISCVSQAFLDKIPRKFVKRLPSCNIVIHGVGNFQKRVREQVELSFTIDGRKFTEKFYALPNSHNVILGLSFLSKYKAIVNLSEAEITLDGQIFKLQRPSTRSSLAKLCHNEIIPAYTNKAVQIKLNKTVISDSIFLSALSSMERNHPDMTFVNTIIANQHTLCRIINNSSEPIALSKGTAVALARNIHSNDVLEMTDFFETVPTSDNDNVDCECAKCLSHDNLQQTEGKSDTGSANSDTPPGGGLLQPATRVHPTPATRGPSHLTSEPGQARSNQDGGSKQEQPTRSADEVSTQSKRKFIVDNNSKAVKLQRKCKCNSKNDLTCDQFDFSTALNTLFMDIPAHNPKASVMNSFVYTSGHCRRWRSRMEVKIMAVSLFVHCKIAYFYSVTTEKWLVVSLPNFVTIRRTRLSISCKIFSWICTTKHKIHAMEFCDFIKDSVSPCGLFVPCSLTVTSTWQPRLTAHCPIGERD